jgi:hypothetical protein
MENTRTIKPISIWNNGKTQKASSLMLYNFGGYDFATGEECFVSYRLGNIVAAEDETMGDRFESLVENSVKLPSDLVAEWGEDDEPIWQFVITELNLTEA